MNVCVVAEYYPRRRDPVLGVWAHEQALAAREAGADVRVLALERPLPPLRRDAAAARVRSRALSRGRLAAAARDAATASTIEYVRFLAPPRGRSYSSWPSS